MLASIDPVLDCWIKMCHHHRLGVAAFVMPVLMEKAVCIEKYCRYRDAIQ